MKVLLQVPDLVAAVQPLVKEPVGERMIFELVGMGKVQPLGYLHRVPVFELHQIAEVAEALQEDESVKDESDKEKNQE